MRPWQLFIAVVLMAASSGHAADPRNLTAGRDIPDEGYCDQPYVVVNDDGSWTCVMTTSAGHEGERSQHVVAVRSEDRGKTWGKPVDIEPPGPPEASYVTAMKAPGGRIYAFYNHNTDDVREVRAESDWSGKPPKPGAPPLTIKRVDTLGHFVFKYSDDGGKSWSARSHEIPVRETRIDRENLYGGKVKFFWHVGRPLIHKDAAHVTLHKVGNFGIGFITKSEGFFLRSDNLLTEKDPAKIRWELLPEGDHGLRTPPGGGPVAEEQSIVGLSDGSLFCTYRTIDGHPATAYSRDDGRTWTEPAYMTYANGRKVKHPRAANFVWRCANGKYLYWFHNHGGKGPVKGYDDRNPAWLAGGVERDGKILWSQPEVLLYDDNPKTRMSYPDLVEQDGKFWVTETQKTVARVHEVDPTLLLGLWGQLDSEPAVAERGMVLVLDPAKLAASAEHPMPPLPRLEPGNGFSIDLSLRLEQKDFDAEAVLLDTRDGGGKGVAMQATRQGTVRLTLGAGKNQSWDFDPGLLKPGQWHRVTATVDGGPKIITFVVDGVLCDGGADRQFGWARFDPRLLDVNAAARVKVEPDRVGLLRVYDRPLRTSEAVANHRATDAGAKP